MIEEELVDTMKNRRLLKKRGPHGTDWYKYYNGVPTEDDDNDYEWSGTCWNIYYRDGE